MVLSLHLDISHRTEKSGAQFWKGLRISKDCNARRTTTRGKREKEKKKPPVFVLMYHGLYASQYCWCYFLIQGM
jgi:hypothetical protein